MMSSFRNPCKFFDWYDPEFPSQLEIACDASMFKWFIAAIPCVHGIPFNSQHLQLLSIDPSSQYVHLLLQYQSNLLKNNHHQFLIGPLQPHHS
ncbi:hypothetical protein H5410_038201 [Solanum commersonii]|uniref:Uncharacterized protein n=1 Tax=Solanum commersonii TaxID=4109 RepID=A0A9J5Y9E8_SOLCO|nr:hypothetical protein H5410_038201 [Solanum commersonii]